MQRLQINIFIEGIHSEEVWEWRKTCESISFCGLLYTYKNTKHKERSFQRRQTMRPESNQMITLKPSFRFWLSLLHTCSRSLIHKNKEARELLVSNCRRQMSITQIFLIKKTKHHRSYTTQVTCYILYVPAKLAKNPSTSIPEKEKRK